MFANKIKKKKNRFISLGGILISDARIVHKQISDQAKTQVEKEISRREDHRGEASSFVGARSRTAEAS